MKERVIDLVPREHWRGDGAKAYDVVLNGEAIGYVEQTWPTFDRKPRGLRYVTSRRVATRPYWNWSVPGRPHYARSFQRTRKAAVALVVEAWERDHAHG